MSVPWYKSVEYRQKAGLDDVIAVMSEAEAAFESGDYQNLITLIQKTIARGVSDFESLILLKCLLNEALCELSRYEEAAEVLMEHEHDLSRLSDKLQAEMLLRIGGTCSWLAQYPKAAARINESVRIFTILGDREGITRGYFELSRLYININEYKIARDYLQRALGYAESFNNRRLIAQILLRLGMVAHYEGDFAEAKLHYRRALKMVEGSREYRLLGSLQMDLANTLFFEERGSADQIIELYESAVRNFEVLSNYDAMAVCYNNLGDCLLRFGMWERASEALERAIEIARTHEYPSSEGLALTTLGELKLRRNDLSEAKRLLVAAIKILDDKSALAHAKRVLGYTYEEGNPASLKAFNSSLQLALAVGDHNEITFSQLALAEYYFARQDYEQANLYLRQAQERLQQKPTPYISGFVQRFTGIMKAVEGAVAEAAQHITSSISIFTAVGDRYELGRSHLELGALLVRSESFERARVHISHAKQILTELGAEYELARVAQLEGAINQHLVAGKQELATVEPVSDAALMRRLGQACIAAEVLLQEFAAIVYEVLRLRRLAIFQKSGEGDVLLLVRGCSDEEALEIHKRRLGSGVFMELPSGRLPGYSFYFEAHTLLTQTLIERLELFLEFLKLGLENCILRSGPTVEAKEGITSYEPSMLIQGFVYSSPTMHRVVDQIKKIRTSDVTVLITGESGTGKELVARAIHAESTRREGAFVAFNCTATPRELIESQLFGHRRGSFTGATSNYLGVIRTAKGGTLFLDEIGDLSLDLQPKLLRFLEAGEIQPLGEARPLKVDVRVIAATNADLAVAVAEKRFREDLYHRLNIIRIHIPPLRERAMEVPMLLNYYLDYFNSRYGKKHIGFSEAAIEILQNYHWPGNVRQLRNEVEKIFTYSGRGDLITPADLSPEIRHSSPQPIPLKRLEPVEAPAKLERFDRPRKLRDVVRPIERELILEAFNRSRGNFTQMARELGLSRRGLRMKIESLGLELPEK